MGENFANIPGPLCECERARSALKSSPIHALRQLEVQRCGESLVLSGKVSSFYQKQLAQELVRTVAKECELVNSVDVRHN